MRNACTHYWRISSTLANRVHPCIYFCCALKHFENKCISLQRNNPQPGCSFSSLWSGLELFTTPASVRGVRSPFKFDMHNLNFFENSHILTFSLPHDAFRCEDSRYVTICTSSIGTYYHGHIQKGPYMRQQNNRLAAPQTTLNVSNIVFIGKNQYTSGKTNDWRAKCIKFSLTAHSYLYILSIR